MMTILTILLVVSICLTLSLLLVRKPSDTEDISQSTDNISYHSISPEEQATRELIGNDKYEQMSSHVAELLKRHEQDRFTTVMLTAGSIERNALKTLHNLLPGDTVRLQDNTRYDIPDVGVYYGEERIGRLLLDDATEALKALKGNLVTGAYIAEQNSYGESTSSISVKLIIFYTSAALPQGSKKDPTKVPYKVIFRGLRPIVIYQN